MTLDDLVILLDSYATGTVGLTAVHERMLPILVADPLDVEASDSTPWDQTHAEARLFWRLIYLFEAEMTDSEPARRTARRTVAALRTTGSPELTFELLPLILDQDRFAAIVDRHRVGTITRTGMLSVIAESGYPAHVKLWLEHAGVNALAGFAAALEEERYDVVAAALEALPGE